MSTAMQLPESFVILDFPRAGIDLSYGFSSQRPKQMPTGEYGRTCADAINVRSFEPGTGRGRGGCRTGIKKYIASPVVASSIVQEVNTLVGIGYDPPSGNVTQLSLSGRVVYVVAVAQGNVYTAQPGDTAWTIATNASGANPPLNYTGVLFSTVLNQKLWFADGVNYVYYDPADNTVHVWAPSVGVLPADSQNNTPRLIETWRGRMCLSGLIKEPQNIFMAKVSDPTNFDYGDPAVPPDMAVALNASPLGLIGQPVMSMIPYNDDVFIIGCNDSIWVINGDPMAGGQIDRVSDSIGMAWGRPWCKDGYGNVYFVSNKTGIYSLTPGQRPQRISQPIEQLVLDLDTGLNLFRLAWNDRYQGLHVFITNMIQPTATTHLFYELRTGAWWKDQFANTNHDPIACCTFDGNLPGDRVVLVGGWDGYVRSIDPTTNDDDGTAIASSVVIGPLTSKDMYDLLTKDLQPEMGESSGTVTFSVYVGNTAEAALASTAIITGTWGPGRSPNIPIRRSAFALYVKITATSYWAIERIRLRLAPTGKVGARQKGVW